MSARRNSFSILMLAAVILCLSVAASAQLNYEYTEGKFMIKGQITDLKSELSVPNANIWIVNQKKGVAADADGHFTMYVYPTDTLKFSSLGYIPKTIPVSAISDKEKYVFSIQLVPDIYSLKAVTIYPFRDRDEFITAFIKGPGGKYNIVIPGIAAPRYIHKEKATFLNPLSAIYNGIQKSKSAADPNFNH